MISQKSCRLLCRLRVRTAAGTDWYYPVKDHAVIVPSFCQLAKVVTCLPSAQLTTEHEAAL